MRRSWKANVLAAITIGVTLFVGALGAQGGPKQKPKHVSTSPSISLKATPTATPVSSRAKGVSRCNGSLASVAVSFACPSGWFVWENDSYAGDPYQQAMIVIANHRPLDRGDDVLPEGWFKADIVVLARDPHLTLDQVQDDTCKSPTGTEIVDSCSRTTIAGRGWVVAVARDTGYEYRTIATAVNGVEYRVATYMRLGRYAAEGRREIAALLASFVVG